MKKQGFFNSQIVQIPVVIIFFFTASICVSQVSTIQGIVADKEGRLLYGVTVSDTSNRTIVSTDVSGAFKIELLCHDSCDLIVSGPGFVSKQVRVSPDQFVTIVLDHNDGPYQERPSVSRKKRTPPGFNSWFGADFRNFDYSSFETSLGYYNVKALNTFQALIAFRIGLDIKNIYVGVDFGFGGGKAIEDDYPDSLNYEVNQTMYGLHVGYHVVNSRHFLISPLMGLKLYRSRLIQSASERKIDIEQYLEDPSLDLRFNQLTWFGGLMVQYKFQDEVASGWTIGAYFGYLGRVNTEPWVKSARNRLLTRNSIEVDPFNLGITLGFYFN
jgi:hypothetical protein